MSSEKNHQDLYKSIDYVYFSQKQRIKTERLFFKK